MKKLIVLLLLLNNYILQSQDLSIELNLLKVEENNFLNIGCLKSKRIIEVPYLEITYRNLSDRNIYFAKLDKCQKENCYPIGLAHKISSNFKYDLNKSVYKDKHNDYKVYLDNRALRDNFIFEIEDISSAKTEETGKIKIYPQRDIIEDRFHTIVGILQLQSLLNRHNENFQLKYFNYRNRKKISVFEAEYWLDKNDFKKIKNIDSLFITESFTVNISQIKDDFIFLKTGESFTEIVNLIGLKLLGKNFEFDYRNLRFNNYEERYNLENKKMERFFYPKNVNGYVPVDENYEISFTPLKVKL